MKNYLVIEDWQCANCTPLVRGQFDNEQDANDFARLSSMANPRRKFWVFQMSK